MVVSQFQGARLTQAREFRQMTKLILSELIEVVSSTISKWEKGEAEPRDVHVDDLSAKLGFDRMFFYRPVRTTKGIDFWRSQSQATRSARERARSKLAWLKEIADYVWSYYDTPRLNLPSVSLPDNFEQIGDDDIEQIAEDVREYWNLGSSPIDNVVRTLERNGIVVGRADLLVDKLDALSEFQRNPFILLSSHKASAVRSRFDAAHELGHILMHRHISQRELNTAPKFSLIEEQAHRFAAAFLLPQKHFVRELWSPSLQALRERKEEWGASIGCMLMRSWHLGVITENQYRNLNVQISKRGWRRREPLDEALRVERPRLLAQCLENLVASKTKSREQILRDLRLPSKEIGELASLRLGFFDTPDDLGIKPVDSQDSPEPRPETTILEFRLPFEADSAS